jgi:predicted DNA-binding protein (MmcQ/YjbR family)
MTPAQLAAYALKLPEVTEEQPFRPGLDVYKVAGKIFAILSATDAPPTIALKADPEIARHLRAQYPAVQPGYHLNKRHWNTVTLDGTVPKELLLEMIENSYDLVVAKLPKAARLRLG